MLIVQQFEQYNKDNVYFLEPIKNNVMNNGNFIRIIYATSTFMLNGIYLLVNLNYFSVDKYFNKYKYSFDISTHADIIEKIRVFEEELINKSFITNKTPQMKIYEQMKNGNIRVFSDKPNYHSQTFILKIAGIWETDKEYGLTYKFLLV